MSSLLAGGAVLAEQVTVLILDGDADLRSLLTDLLSFEGYRALAVATLDEARQTLLRERVGAILADYWARPRHPRDFNLFYDLHQAAPGVPIILCTTHPQVSAIHPEQHVVFAVLPKPFDLDELLSVVAGAVTWHRRESA